jgi:cytochrome P450
VISWIRGGESWLGLRATCRAILSSLCRGREWAEKVVSTLGLLPQAKPTVYTGIRNHALKSWLYFSRSSEKGEKPSGNTIVEKLWESHVSQTERGGLTDMEIASEAADHLLAGVDTTSDTLMFLIWALSLPENSNTKRSSSWR